MERAHSNRRLTMEMSRLLGVIVGALALWTGPDIASAAGKYDGSAPLVCVPTVVTECRVEGECRRVTAESVNLPQFFKVDVKAQKVHSEETGRASPFTSVEHVGGNLILQGAQSGRGWTMTISEETGKMSAAISSGAEGWIVFGGCMAP
jgi:hypothetical protein